MIRLHSQSIHYVDVDNYPFIEYATFIVLEEGAYALDDDWIESLEYNKTYMSVIISTNISTKTGWKNKLTISSNA